MANKLNALFFTLVALLGATGAFGQRIIWERVFVRDIVGDQGEVLFLDTLENSENIIFYGIGKLRVSILASFGVFGLMNRNGDTILTRDLDETMRFPQFCKVKTPKTHYWMSDIRANERNYHFSRLDTAGRRDRRILIVPDTLSDTFEQVDAIIGTNDGGFIAAGYLEKTIAGFNRYVEHVARYDSAGNRVWWQTFINPYGYSMPKRIEPTNRGTFLISGSDGPDIYIHEIDSNGVHVRRRVLYTHPQRYGWFDAKVYQHPQGYIVIGYTAPGGTLPRGYNGFYNLNYSRVWGGQLARPIYEPAINSDGSFWSLSSDISNNIYYSRYNIDSTISRSLLINSPSQPLSRGVGNILYLGDGSALFGGYSTYRNDPNQNRSFYLCKIDSIGLPYDPTPVASKVAGRARLQVYPNPSTGTIHVAGLAQAATYQLYSLQGKLLQSGILQPTDALSLESYHTGLYLLHIDGSVVKVVKR